MRHFKKAIVLILAVVMCSVFAVACGGGNTNISGIVIAGDSGSGSSASPYETTMVVGTAKELDVTVAPSNATNSKIKWEVVKKDGENYVVDASGKLTLTYSAPKLKLTATTAGIYYVRGTAEDSGKFAVYAKVTVAEDSVLSTSISVRDFDAGDGSAATPYTYTVAKTQQLDIGYAVRPNDATDKTVNFKVVKKSGNDYVDLGADVAGISIVTTANKVTVTGITAGEVCYIYGQSNDKNAKVYLAVTVGEYTAVESVTSTTLKPITGQAYNYELKTAVGTKWDMTDGEMACKGALIAGEGDKKLDQAPRNLTYYPLLAGFGVEVLPVDASNKELDVSYSNAGIIKVNTDYSFVVEKAGETIVTFTSVADASKKIAVKVVAEDTLYPGVLKSEYDLVTATNNYNWNFDADYHTQTQFDRYDQWKLVVGQSTYTRKDIASTKGDSGIKLFYLGDTNRTYGMCLEGHVSSLVGDINLASNLMWSKVNLTNDVRSISVKIGKNNKPHIMYRVSYVTSAGVVTTLSADWESFVKLNEVEEKIVQYDLPLAVRGTTGAIVIEQKLTKANDNGELQIKDIHINTYSAVSGVTVSNATGTLGQGGKFNLGAIVNVAPANATDKSVTYSINDNSGKVTVSTSGVITVAKDATPKDYVITVTSVDNASKSAIYTLTVEQYIPVTGMTVKGLTASETYNFTFDSATTGINFTDKPIDLAVTFAPENASIKTFSVTFGTPDIVKYDSATSKLSFVGVGTTTITVASTDDVTITQTYTFVVGAYAVGTSFVEGTQITKTEMKNTSASNTLVWDTKALVTDEWNVETVYKSHGNAKIAGIEGDGRIIFEGHSNDINSKTVNIAWNKVTLGANIKTFEFMVRSHDDDRAMESASFKVSVISNLDATPTLTEIIPWTTVAMRWKQKNEKMPVDVDLTAYTGQTIIIYIEQTAGFANDKYPNQFSSNANTPKADSGAGAYLHLDGMKLLTEAKPFATDPRIAMNESATLSAGWTATNNAYGVSANVFETAGDKILKAFSLDYSGATAQTLVLGTTSAYAHGGTEKPMFLVWGLFPALDNTCDGSVKVSYALKSGETFVSLDVDGKTLTVNSAGSTHIIAKFAKRGGGTLDVNIKLNIAIV